MFSIRKRNFCEEINIDAFLSWVGKCMTDSILKFQQAKKGQMGKKILFQISIVSCSFSICEVAAKIVSIDWKIWNTLKNVFSQSKAKILRITWIEFTWNAEAAAAAAENFKQRNIATCLGVVW